MYCQLNGDFKEVFVCATEVGRLFGFIGHKKVNTQYTTHTLTTQLLSLAANGAEMLCSKGMVRLAE